MAKKGPFDKFGLGGVRRKSPGNDPNLGPFEARLRGEQWSESNKLTETLRQTQTPQAHTALPAIPSSGPTTWWQFLTPTEIRWTSIEGWANLDSSDGIRSLNVKTVPKGQTLVITQWTPLWLEEDPGNTAVLRELNSFSRVFANLTISGNSPIVSEILPNFDDPSVGTLTGTTFMNEPAWPSAPNMPVILYAPSTSLVGVVFQWNAGELDPSNEDFIYAGFRITGFYIADSTLKSIAKRYSE